MTRSPFCLFRGSLVDVDDFLRELHHRVSRGPWRRLSAQQIKVSSTRTCSPNYLGLGRQTIGVSHFICKLFPFSAAHSGRLVSSTRTCSPGYLGSGSGDSPSASVVASVTISLLSRAFGQAGEQYTDLLTWLSWAYALQLSGVDRFLCNLYPSLFNREFGQPGEQYRDFLTWLSWA